MSLLKPKTQKKNPPKSKPSKKGDTYLEQFFTDNRFYLSLCRVKGGWVAKKLFIQDGNLMIENLNDPGSKALALARFKRELIVLGSRRNYDI